MQPLTHLRPSHVQSLRGVCFDLDDTLLDHGRLSKEAYSALFSLREAGLELYGVTGRPAIWGQLLARQWPVNGMVTENGRVSFLPQGNRILTIDPVPTPVRLERRARLNAIAAELVRQFPELTPCEDNATRWTDLTFDIGEYQKTPRDLVQKALAVAIELGARTSVSSVHAHIGLDPGDKAEGAVALIHRNTGLDPSAIVSQYAYVGDSDNDAPCFGAFRLTFGVANFSGRPTLTPRFITSQPRGAGFAELATALLAARSGAGGNG